MDVESLLIKKQSSQNNPEKSHTGKKAIHEACGYSINSLRSYEPNKNIRNFHRGKDYIKKLCGDLQTQAMEVINFKERKMVPLTDDETKYYEKWKYYHICKRKFWKKNDENEKNKFKVYCKVRDHCHYARKGRGAAHTICNLRYKIQQEIPVVLHKGSTYDYHFIINELAKQFEGNMECIGENMEKYISLKVPPKTINENGKPIIYNLKFIDSFRFMATSLSNLADNLSDINKKERKSCKERDKILINCAFIK